MAIRAPMGLVSRDQHTSSWKHGLSGDDLLDIDSALPVAYDCHSAHLSGKHLRSWFRKMDVGLGQDIWKEGRGAEMLMEPN